MTQLKAIARVKETAAATDVAQSILRFADLRSGKATKISGSFVVPLQGRVQFASVIDGAKKIRKAVSEEHFNVYVNKKNSSLWMSFPYTKKVSAQVEILSDWGLAIVRFDTSLSNADKVLRDSM